MSKKLSAEFTTLIRAAYRDIQNKDDESYNKHMEELRTITPDDHLQICNTKNPRMVQ